MGGSFIDIWEWGVGHAEKGLDQGLPVCAGIRLSVLKDLYLFKNLEMLPGPALLRRTESRGLCSSWDKVVAS